MKSIKKILAAVMATAVVGVACVIPASAAFESTAQFSVEQKVITVEEAASPVTIEFTLDNNTVVNASAFKFTYDTANLELTKMVSGAGIQEVVDDGGISASAPNKANGMFALACTPGETVLGASGQIVKLTFKVIDTDIQPGDKYDISVVNTNDVVQEIETGNKVVLSPSFTDGYIMIKEEATTTTTEATTTVTTTTTPAPTTTVTTTTTPAPTTTVTTTTTPAPTTTVTTTTTPAPTTTVTTTTTPTPTTTTTATTTAATTPAPSKNNNTNTNKTTSSPTTGDTSSAAGMLAVLGLAGAAAIATKKKNK